MKFFNKRSPTREKRSDDADASQVVMTLPTAFQELLSTGYTKLPDSPEVRMAVDTIADMVFNMTTQLMQNGETGDKRVKNALSRVVDIEPNKYLSRKNFIQWIVRSMLLEGMVTP